MAKQRFGLILAVAVAAFALVATGGVAATAVIQSATPAKAAESNTVNATAAAADTQAQVNAVDTAYRKQLEEANARIKQANAEITQLKQRVTQMQNAQATQTAQSAQAAQQQYRLSADDAAQLVLRAAPGTTLLGQPELVDFRGTAAYEVQLDAGTVYVDANSGEFLYAQRGHRAPQSNGGEDSQENEEHESNEFGG